MRLERIERLIAACEREYLCADEPDDSDVSLPPSGITMGMIREARAELNAHDWIAKRNREAETTIEKVND